MRRASRIAGPLLVVITMTMGSAAFAQVDLSGEWAGTFYEDLPHRGGMQLGDYTGLPLNEAGWRKAQSWDEAGDWLTVFTIVDDPRYLSQQFITNTHFKREADASAWSPAPCGAK
jgi:hypothetical protein